MTQRGEGAWAPEAAARFFKAFHEHGQDWDQVSEAVGEGQSAEACEELFRKQHAYLCIPKHMQSGQAFVAIVKNAQMEASAGPSPSSTSQGGSGGGGAGREPAGSGGAAGSMQGGEREAVEQGFGDERRSRRTPKRSDITSPGGRATGRHTPVSGVKRSRGGAGGGAGGGSREEELYELYGEAAEALTESARKQRVARQRLDFAPQGGGRRHDAEEAKGIDALLALAVAGEETAMGSDSQEEEAEGGGGYARQSTQQPVSRRKKSAAKPRGRRAAPAADVDWEEEPADAGAMDDDGDEDFAPPPRRTPYSTPAKAGRLPRPGSAHATPRRTGSRGGAGSGMPASSPGTGLRGLSPYLMGSLEGGDMLDLGMADLGYIASPGFPHFQPGFVPSPQNPMPRLRSRKSAPERTQPSVASPVKTLFTRRSSLAGGPSLMASFGYTSRGGGDGGSGAAAAAPPQTAAEACLRHCLQQPRTQRWAAAEFAYSALDRPFFMFNPLSGLLAQLGLVDDARLTRREWSLVRSGLGKPRRLSLKFLKEERVRLERWREGCRQQYVTGAAAVSDPKVADHLPLPLGVGQRVAARHPATRQLHDGSVLTVANSYYRVQFDRQELGVELVRDTDVMPVDPYENLPPALLAARPHMLLNGRQIVNGQPVRPLAPRHPPLALPSPAMAATAAAVAAASAVGTPLATGPPASTSALLASAQADAAALGAGEAEQPSQQQQPQQQQQQQQDHDLDVHVLSKLVVELDKKEALVQQLRGMNDEAAAGAHADASGAAAPPFVNAYANVMLQLKDVNVGLQDKLEHVVKHGSDPAATRGAADASAVQQQLLQQQLAAGGAAEAVLQSQLVAHTPEALSAAALEQARSVIAICCGKLAESAAAEDELETGAASLPSSAAYGGAAPWRGAAGKAASTQAQEGQTLKGQDERAAAAAAASSNADLVKSNGEGQRLGALIEGCVHSLVLLLQGARNGSLLPVATLSAALDQALQTVQPASAANLGLYREIEEVVSGLKQHISAAS
ncbi:hypothetical protein D9Q98_003241 [Chlorella vulgaris]|uniref:DIRP domain-containing protein n=1 Tax=Chlorella vulgaris TaxID=3077 RepID=A0A9D4YYU4_CHLVU|nr:hypothetical protein D9Q98_003241 [Chlorella vulgaris]